MKAVFVESFGSPEVLKVKQTEIPKIGANEVLVKVVAISVNFADVKARSGMSSRGKTPPFLPGLDCSGIVEQVGAEVTSVSVGDRVMCFPANGAYAEYVVCSEVLTFPIPESISFHVAASFPIVGITSYNILHKMAQIRPKESVLVHAAAGGIGTTAIQMAKLAGASLIIGTCGSEEKKKVALEAGADVVINYTTENFADKVNEVTDGKGVDIILDSIGGETFERGLSCLARFGRMVVFGEASGESGQVNTGQLHASCRLVLGYSSGTYRKFRPEELREPMNEAIGYLKEGKVNMVIGHTFKLEEAEEAHRLMEERKSTGKILLIP